MGNIFSDLGNKRVHHLKRKATTSVVNIFLFQVCGRQFHSRSNSLLQHPHQLPGFYSACRQVWRPPLCLLLHSSSQTWKWGELQCEFKECSLGCGYVIHLFFSIYIPLLNQNILIISHLDYTTKWKEGSKQTLLNTWELHSNGFLFFNVRVWMYVRVCF